MDMNAYSVVAGADGSLRLSTPDGRVELVGGCGYATLSEILAAATRHDASARRQETCDAAHA